jgi:hypothetical protein
MRLCYKTRGETLKDEFGIPVKFEPVKRPFVSRTLLLDIPETLIINVMRYSVVENFTIKDQSDVKF